MEDNYVKIQTVIQVMWNNLFQRTLLQKTQGSWESSKIPEVGHLGILSWDQDLIIST